MLKIWNFQISIIWTPTARKSSPLCAHLNTMRRSATPACMIGSPHFTRFCFVSDDLVSCINSRCLLWPTKAAHRLGRRINWLSKQAFRQSAGRIGIYRLSHSALYRTYMHVALSGKQKHNFTIHISRDSWVRTPRVRLPAGTGISVHCDVEIQILYPMSTTEYSPGAKLPTPERDRPYPRYSAEFKDMWCYTSVSECSRNSNKIKLK